MNFDEFKKLFFAALEQAALNTEELIDQKISRNYKIELHGAGFSGDIMTADEAAEFLYINENEFWYVIDVSVKKAFEDKSLVFVRASGHPPAPIENTWNYANGAGPFKEIIANKMQGDE